MHEQRTNKPDKTSKTGTSKHKQHKSNRQASTDNLVDPILESNRDGSPTLSSASNQVKSHHKESMRLFEALLDAGVCREQARGVLPQNLYTQYFGTVNLHNLLKFVSLRVHEGAQWEIQQVAKACLEIAKAYFPHSVQSYMKHKMEH